MPEAARWVAVAEFGAVLDADIAVETLEQAGIPARTRAESAGIFGLAYSGTVTGGAVVLVPEDRAREARELLLDGPTHRD